MPAVAGIAGAIGGAAASLGGMLATAAGAVGSAVGTAAGAVGGALGSAASAVGGAIGSAAGSVGGAFGAAGGAVAEGLLAAVGGPATSVATTVAPAAQAAGAVAPAAAGLLEGAAAGAQGAATGAQGAASLMSNVAGGGAQAAPMSTMPSIGMSPNMSTPAGPVYSAPTQMPTSGTSGMNSLGGVGGEAYGPDTSMSMKIQQFKDNPWVKAGSKLLKGASGQQQGQGQQVPPVGGGAPAQNIFPAGPLPAPYRSTHVQAQQDYAKSVMDAYLASGGAFYG